MTDAVSTSSDSYIDCPPATVYAFVTQPHNWVGTHPVTSDVRVENDCDFSEVGAVFTETISGDGTPHFDVTWRVSAAEWGRRWIIDTDELGDSGVSCRIRYEFEPSGRGTAFSRHMTVHYLSRQPAAGAYRVPPEGAASPDVHDRYIEAVKRRLESADSPGQPT